MVFKANNITQTNAFLNDNKRIWHDTFACSCLI